MVVKEVNNINGEKTYEVEIDKTVVYMLDIIASSKEEAEAKAWDIIDSGKLKTMEPEEEMAEHHVFVY